ncbi:hypothetical protein SEPCBS119000_003872 [Sporothrix epigloea]|uniref:Uncharacterized protein n=1 Tax=Sporothrix epigloea TaxID=1892477 RepID=A0ABP0DP21_9PEZI
MAVADYTSHDFQVADCKHHRRTSRSLKQNRNPCPPSCVDCCREDAEYNKEPLPSCLRDENRSKTWQIQVDSNKANKLHRSASGTRSLRRHHHHHHPTVDAQSEIQMAKSMSSSFLISNATYTPPSRAAILDGGTPLHSFDMLDSPLHSLPLAAFVKAPSVRDTERMVNREYEIVDSNGAMATGRRARELLRQPPALYAIPATDGDFELI